MYLLSDLAKSNTTTPKVNDYPGVVNVLVMVLVVDNSDCDSYSDGGDIVGGGCGCSC